jgi:hypothetical protein
LLGALQKKKQLPGIELLARGSKKLAHEQVDLLPQERVLLLQLRQPLIAGLEFLQELSFARIRHTSSTTGIASC